MVRVWIEGKYPSFSYHLSVIYSSMGGLGRTLCVLGSAGSGCQRPVSHRSTLWDLCGAGALSQPPDIISRLVLLQLLPHPHLALHCAHDRFHVAGYGACCGMVMIMMHAMQVHYFLHAAVLAQGPLLELWHPMAFSRPPSPGGVGSPFPLA